jgi:hypothetical protein
MNRNKIFIWFLVALATLLSVLLLQHYIRPQRQHTAETPVVPATNILPATTGVATTNPTTPYPARPQGLPEAAWSRMVTYFDWTKSQNSPLDFYVNVLDQDSQPVSGTTLTLEISYYDEQWIFRPDLKKITDGDLLKHKRVELTSDGSGRCFFNEGKGVIIDVVSVSKAGYYWQRPATMGTFNYTGGQHIINTFEMTNAFNHTTGYNFFLWKLGQTEQLVRMDVGVKLPESHRVWLNIFNHEVKDPTNEWADFVIVETLLHPNDPEKQYDRTISIQGANGAKLIATSDYYPYLAPESGYQPDYSFDVLPSTGRGQGGTWDWTKNFYLVAREGKVHAGLAVNFVGGKLFFGFSGYLNPSGSRNLEPDPAKLIIDPAEIHHIDEATRTK